MNIHVSRIQDRFRQVSALQNLKMYILDIPNHKHGKTEDRVVRQKGCRGNSILGSDKSPIAIMNSVGATNSSLLCIPKND